MGTLVMGTVKGDLHLHRQKNPVLMMAEGAGFKCVNLGTNTSAPEFIAAVREHNATILGMSALLTTTMIYMKTVITEMEAAGLGHVKICVGGAPVTQLFADEIGADGYAPEPRLPSIYSRISPRKPRPPRLPVDGAGPGKQET
ncbi:MAG: hypothetical protein Ct9H300mP32_4950 [Verrucomicrobiota bacterium]|nr:MAG: hypothetical protein Ct9H300mP32_4950 [Verrucomicrobiota bacterium]